MARLPISAPSVAAATWRELLSPQAVAEYVFTGYDSLLSHLAMEQLSQQDFPLVEGTEDGSRVRTAFEEPETESVTALRAVLAELYAGSTCALTREGNRYTLAITVPGGTGSTWPGQIPQPGPISYPTVGGHPQEQH